MKTGKHGAKNSSQQKVMSENTSFAIIPDPARLWVLSPVFGEKHRLAGAHRLIAEHYRPGDKVIYTGNLMGYGPDVGGTLDEALAFRRALIASPGATAEDVIYLRGGQEEMWRKCLQLQFAPEPESVFNWMREHGLRGTLAAYGSDETKAGNPLRKGTVAISRWTASLRAAMNARDGHAAYMSALKHAATTTDKRFLITSAGLAPNLPLYAQKDHLWWGHPDFDTLSLPWEGYSAVIRGLDPAGSGPQTDGPVYTLKPETGVGLALFDKTGALEGFTPI